MPKHVKRGRRPSTDDWPERPLPESAAARRRIAVILSLLALAGLLAHLLSLLANRS